MFDKYTQIQIARPLHLPHRVARNALLAMVAIFGVAACSTSERSKSCTLPPQQSACSTQGALERELAAIPARLRLELPDRYAGRGIFCSDPAVVVLLKGDSPMPPRMMQSPRGAVPISFITGCPYSSKDLVLIINSGKVNELFPTADGIAADQVGGRIEVYAIGEEKLRHFQEMSTEAGKSLGVPLVVRKAAPVKL